MSNVHRRMMAYKAVCDIKKLDSIEALTFSVGCEFQSGEMKEICHFKC